MDVRVAVPNLVSAARIALAPFIFYAIVREQPAAALGLFACAAATDGLDGMLARRWGSTSRSGAYLDPIADKILLSGVYLSLAAAAWIPWWLVAVIFGRDIFLLTAAGAVMLFTRVRRFDPNVWGKASTFVQIVCAVAFMGEAAVRLPILHILARLLIWPTAALTVWSGAYYAWRGWRIVENSRGSPGRIDAGIRAE